MNSLHIDVVSDVVCPWCFIGKRHLDRALEMWKAEEPQCEVAVRWRPFFLSPEVAEAGVPYRPYLEKKFGGAERLDGAWQQIRAAGDKAGIAFAFERIELRANTLNAHRLIHYAQHSAVDGATMEKLIEGLFSAQFLEGRFIGDRAVLVEVAAASGMDAEAVRRYLDSDEDAERVRTAAAEATRLGINGVPFFIFDQRLGASGAQQPEALLKAMREAASPANEADQADQAGQTH
jgi:predicted DsbA family dithiol-disulfide isomerase